jgi:chromosome segregation ATPase
MEKEKQKSAPPAGALEDLEAENAKLSIRLDQTNSDMDILKQAYERELAFKEEQLDKQQKQMSMEIEKLTSQSTHARHQVAELTQELSQLQTRYKTAVDEFERKETELKANLTREQAAHEITMNELRRSLAKVPTLLCVRTMQFSLC